MNIGNDGNSASIGIDNNQDGEFNELDNLFRGVAPKAHLLIGKVCSDYGGCSTSDIIAGIEWAVSKSMFTIEKDASDHFSSFEIPIPGYVS